MIVNNLIVKGDTKLNGKLIGIPQVTSKSIHRCDITTACNSIKIGHIKFDADINSVAQINFSMKVSRSGSASYATEPTPTQFVLVLDTGDYSTNTDILIRGTLYDFGQVNNSTTSEDSQTFIWLARDSSASEYEADIYISLNYQVESAVVLVEVLHDEYTTFTQHSESYTTAPWPSQISVEASRKVIANAHDLLIGASTSTSGYAGLVPAPSAGVIANRFLRADGKWELVDFTAFEHAENSDVDTLFDS